MTIKELFEKAENGVFTLEQFEEAAKECGAKFTDISEGNYVSKHKYDTDIGALNTQVEQLNGTITQRDTDLAKLQKDLEAAGANAENLATVQNSLTELQTKYTNDTKEFQNQLKKQAYEFAVKEFAGTKKFTSQAAKRDFVNSMIAKELKMDKGVILGAEDFVTSYTADNADAFVTENPNPENDPNPQPPKPSFVNPTPGPTNPEQNAFMSAFHFTGVRPMPKE